MAATQCGSMCPALPAPSEAALPARSSAPCAEARGAGRPFCGGCCFERLRSSDWRRRSICLRFLTSAALMDPAAAAFLHCNALHRRVRSALRDACERPQVRAAAVELRGTRTRGVRAALPTRTAGAHRCGSRRGSTACVLCCGGYSKGHRSRHCEAPIAREHLELRSLAFAASFAEWRLVSRGRAAHCKQLRDAAHPHL